MQRYIEGLAKGLFDYDRPRIYAEEESLALNVGPDEVYKGSLILKAEDDRRVEGNVYSRGHRMVVATPEFDGNEVDIKYEFNSFGMQPGSEYRGRFVVVSTGGELEIPYLVSVSEEADTGDTGMELSDLARMAAEDWYKAYELYSSDRFLKSLKNPSPYISAVYRALNADGVHMQCMEEFLTGTGAKEPIDFELAENGEIFRDITGTYKASFRIRKTDWGYIRLVISSDCDFVIIQKNVIDTEDFVGNNCEVNFFINTSGLHAGTNYGRIVLSSPCRSREYLFRVICGSTNVRSIKELEIRHNISECIESLSECILGRITDREWADAFLDRLKVMSEEEPDNKWYALLYSAALALSMRPEAARIITDEFKMNNKPEDDPDKWALYLYVMTLLETEDYVKERIINEFRELSGRGKDSLLFAVLSLYMENIPESASVKYLRIKSCFEAGGCSPLLYAAASVLINEDPLLISHPEETDLTIMRWMVRKNCVGAEAGSQFMEQLMGIKKFSERVCSIAEGICKTYDTPDNISMLVSFLIRMDIRDPEYNKYYLKGIEHDLKVTKLYEYYIDSIDEESSIELPKVIYMYFKYNISIDNRKKAYIFANLIQNKKKYPDIYENFRDAMIEFAHDQFQKGVINDNMAVIYNEFFHGRMITESTCEQFMDILSAYRFETENVNVSQVTVVYNRLAMEHTYAVTDGRADIFIYSVDYELVFSDGKVRFMSGVEYSITPFVDFEKYLRSAVRLYKNNEKLIIRYLESGGDFKIPEADELDMRYVLLASDKIRGFYKSEIKADIIDFYHKKDSDHLSEKLLDITLKDLTPEKRIELADILISRGYYEHAYKLVRSFGYEQISLMSLLKLGTYIIEKYNYEPSLFLDNMCMDVYEKGIFNQQTIRFLKNCHSGALEDLNAIRLSCESFGIDTYSITEQIIRQSLFTGKEFPGLDDVYEQYVKMGVTETLNRAYLQYYAYQYLIKGKNVSPGLFDHLFKEYRAGEKLSDISRLALLKYRSTTPMEESFREAADKLLRDFLYRGYYFESFGTLDRLYNLSLVTDGRSVIEYTTNPEKKVWIHYTLGNGEYADDEMTNSFEGIFTKEFNLFYGEEIQFYITEEKGDAPDSGEIVKKGRYKRNDPPGAEPLSNVDLLNTILYDIEQQKPLEAAELLREYNHKKAVSEKFFTVM